MPSITAGGIGSGLDINDLVRQLVAAEGEPVVARLDRREAELQAKISAFGFLKGALSDLQGALARLKDTSVFQARSATSGDTDVFTASASGTAAAGSHAVEVVRLAEAHKLLSEGFADASTNVGTGTLTIGVGAKSFSVFIDDSNKTLAGISRAINSADENAGVTATIINVDDGLGGTVSKLVLRSSGTGEENELSIVVDDDDLDDTDTNGLSSLVYDPDGSGTTNLSEIQPAVDAQMKVDGQSVTRGSNVISDAIEGVSITLVSAMPGEQLDLTVSPDNGAVSGAVDSFVGSFNALVDTLAQLTSYNAETGQAGTLLGDSTARSVDALLRRELARQGPGGGDPGTLSAIGITTDANGKLTIDSAKLNEALERDSEAVPELFAGADGYAVRLDHVLSGFVSTGGLIDDRTGGLDNRVGDILDQRETLDRRLAGLEERLLAQFSAMDVLVANLRATGDFLSQQLVGLQALLPGQDR